MNLNDKELSIRLINNYFVIFITLLIVLSVKTMTDFHFVIIGTAKGESKDIALENLKTAINKNEEIKDISELKIFGKTL
jgi:hypothetical protein